MARIPRWDYELKVNRKKIIGEFIGCPICLKNALSTWEGERLLSCTNCGARYQKKQRYRAKLHGK